MSFLPVCCFILFLALANADFHFDKIENFTSSQNVVAEVKRVWYNQTNFDILIDVKVPVKKAYVSRNVIFFNIDTI